MSLQIAEAGCIRNRDVHAACGREKDKLAKIIESAHFADRVADAAERAYHSLNERKVSIIDVLLRKDELLGAIDFGSLAKAKRIADQLCEEHGEAMTVEMRASDHSLFSIRERVDAVLALVEPLRKHLRP